MDLRCWERRHCQNLEGGDRRSWIVDVDGFGVVSSFAACEGKLQRAFAHQSDLLLSSCWRVMTRSCGEGRNFIDSGWFHSLGR